MVKRASKFFQREKSLHPSQHLEKKKNWRVLICTLDKDEKEKTTHIDPKNRDTEINRWREIENERTNECARYVYVGKAISSFAKRFYRLKEIRYDFLLLFFFSFVLHCFCFCCFKFNISLFFVFIFIFILSHVKQLREKNKIPSRLRAIV